MIDKFLNWAGSGCATIAAATASITQEDARLWAVALASIGISIFGSWRSRRKKFAEAKTAEYIAQGERIKLCMSCAKSYPRPTTCVVDNDKRPNDCPIKRHHHDC